jgi:DNA polymerase-1
MKTIAIDTEYDYTDPFLATTTDDDLVSRVYRPRILSQRRELRGICESKNIRKVFHHATGDMFILRNIGIHVVPPFECTLIASNLVNENYASRRLKTLAKVHLGEEIKESNLLRSTIKRYKKRALKDGQRFKWSDIPDEIMLPYAKRDPEYTIKLWFFWQIPIEQMRPLYEFEKSIIPIVVDMTWKGVRVDRYFCARKSREYGKQIELIYEDMSKYVVDNKIDLGLGKALNPRSPKQMQTLVESLIASGEIDENDITRTEKTNAPKTDKKALVKLSLSTTFFKMMQRFRFYTKHKGTYYDPLYDYYTSEKNDVAHFMLYQTGAKTGRFSAELVQTFPRPEDSALSGTKHEVRKTIIPRRGKVFLCKDYEQQEMKLFIHYSNCETMIEHINKMGGRIKDIYVDSGEVLFGKMFDDKDLRKPLRYITKKDALAGIYGVGVNKLISTTLLELAEKFDQGIIDKIGVSSQWAYDVLQRFYKLYPVREFTQQKISELYKKGYIELEFDSPLMKFKRRYNIPRQLAYKGPNATIQGTAAYVIKHAMKRVDNRIDREGWRGKVDTLLQVHDELIFEVDHGMDLMHVDSILTEEMEDWVTFKVPITCSAKWSDKSWYDVEDLNTWKEKKNRLL